MSKNIFNIINILKQTPFRQQGAILLLMLVVLVVGATTLLITSLSATTLQFRRDKVTSDALMQAKEALVGRAVADGNRPGSLPCPDTHTPGNSLEGTADSTCTTNIIGRLPWKTLGLPDLRDGDGESLWYTLSPNFADNTSNTINSNSNGTLLVYDNNGTTLVTQPGSEAVAIIFSSGGITSSQQRNSSAEQTDPLNYLDSGPGGWNNSNASGPFVAASKSGTFNDRLLIITPSDIIPKVEMRVTTELAKALANYRLANGNKYPFPASFGSCSALNCNSDATQCIGKIPVSTMSSVMTTMTWFKNNNWFDVIYYTAGTANLPGGAGGGGGGGGKKGKGKRGGWSWGGGGGGSTACTSSFLTVQDSDGSVLTTNASALFILPDSAASGAARSSLGTANLANYFEDTENGNLNSTYILPTANSNDSLYILP